MRRTRRRAAGAGALCAFLLAVIAPGAVAELPPPDGDPFYAAPERLAKRHLGAVLRSRPVDLSASNISVAHRAWQILYRTGDTRGRPEAAMATLIVPSDPPASRRPLVAYQPAEDSLTRDCASSYELRTGSGAEPGNFSMALERGWAVVVPDYEGPHSQWIAGVQAGHAVLDAVRAAKRFGRAGLGGRRTPIGLWGYSGGGQATAWASELQPRYAPRLNLVGVAHGGAASDVEVTARNVDGGPASGLLFAAAVGLSRAYPAMRIDELLNEAGREMVSRIGEMCLEDFVAAYPMRRLSEFTTVPDALALPRIQRVMDQVSLGRHTPRAPLFIYHAILDILNPISASDALVETYCRQGATVHYTRDPASDHIALAITGAPAAVEYLAARFGGEPAPDDCPSLAGRE